MTAYRNFEDTGVPGLDEANHELIEASLNLFGITGSTSFRVLIPNTTPPLYVMCGEAKDIDALLLTITNGAN